MELFDTESEWLDCPVVRAAVMSGEEIIVNQGSDDEGWEFDTSPIVAFSRVRESLMLDGVTQGGKPECRVAI